MPRTKGSKNKQSLSASKVKRSTIRQKNQQTQDESFFSEIGRVGGQSKGTRAN